MSFHGHCQRLASGRRLIKALALHACVLGAFAAAVRAQDAPPYLLAQPAQYTNVIDAFEDHDPVDFNVHLGFTRSMRHGVLQRERATPANSGAGVPTLTDIANTTQIINALELGLDAGLYKDLMVYGRLPLVLSDSRQLDWPDWATCTSGACPARARDTALLTDTPPGGGMPARLFGGDLPFRSKTRSGVPHIDLGLAWGITNQYRDSHLPTWVIMLEGRVGAGSVMKPCADGASCDPGISRGTARLKLESRWSYRFRYVEPYMGVSYAYEIATSAADRFSPHGALAGYVDATPPSVTEVTIGAEFVPWEHRGRFQRFAIDALARAGYVSAGRDYSVLFDALGSSQNPYLTTPNNERLIGDPSNLDVRFSGNGLTNVDAHARLALEAALAMQAARYVRFRLGLGFAYTEPHLLTDAQACNTAVQARSGDVRACSGGGLWNPLYRSVIDTAGRRFRLASELALDLFASATAQF
ncbi:MAG TPA: hypothetical protein VF331_26530 [Polyangiales bacterium]